MSAFFCNLDPRFVLVLFMALGAFSGCDSYENRRRISRHIDDLVSTVKMDPQSPAGKAALDDLIALVHGDWGFARSQACRGLGRLGPLAAPAVPDLIHAAKSNDRFVEDAAVRALGPIGKGAAPAVDLLISKIERGIDSRSRAGVTWHAARSLGDIGEPAKKAIPVLQRGASQTDCEFLADESKIAIKKINQAMNSNRNGQSGTNSNAGGM